MQLVLRHVCLGAALAGARAIGLQAAQAGSQAFLSRLLHEDGPPVEPVGPALLDLYNESAPSLRPADAPGEAQAAPDTGLYAELGQAQAATSPESEPQAQRQYKGKVLIVDPRGPSRQQGEGVRVMGMILDLSGEECGLEVDILANTNDFSGIRDGWSDAVQHQYLKNVHFISVANYNLGLVDLSSYDRIIIGGKADLMRPGGAGVVSTVISDLVALSGGDRLSTSLRNRTSAFWDDVPFERCTVDNSCATVAPTVAQIAGAVSTFYVLTAEDALRMSAHMRFHGITPLGMRVWPMRITNMARVLPEERFSLDPTDQGISKKRYVLMMGNHHPVNTKNLEELFDSGALNDICNEIESRSSPIKLLLTGAMTSVAQRIMARTRGNTKCVYIRDGFVSNQELSSDILPQTRAIMNPFFFDVKSGISVKSFEAIMEGFPLLTSFYGLHGLNDIPQCVFPQPERPSSAESFKDFLIKHVVIEDGLQGYRNFSKYFSKAAEDCIRGQELKYPVELICEA